MKKKSLTTLQIKIYEKGVNPVSGKCLTNKIQIFNYFTYKDKRHLNKELSYKEISLRMNNFY
jgi:hypothetical protein